MNGYQPLGLDERRDIYRLVATGRSVREVAASLRRHPSTIYRELKRNRHLDEHPLFRGYFPTVAQTMARGRRLRGWKIARQPELAVRADSAMVESPAVFIYPRPIRSAHGRWK